MWLPILVTVCAIPVAILEAMIGNWFAVVAAIVVTGAAWFWKPKSPALIREWLRRRHAARQQGRWTSAR